MGTKIVVFEMDAYFTLVVLTSYVLKVGIYIFVIQMRNILCFFVHRELDQPFLFELDLKL